MRRTRYLIAATAALGALTLVGHAPATAAGPVDVEFAATEHGPVLVDQAGRQYPVQVVEFPERQVVQAGRPLLARTVMLTATLPGAKSAHGGATTLGDTAGSCESDGSVSVRACLTQFFTRSGSYVAVDHYAASWTRLDSQVRLVRGTILASVLGRCRSGCSSLNKTESKPVSAPGNGATYTFYPSWNGIFVEVNNVRYQCGNSTLNWSRGTGSYTFQHSNVCQGSIP